MDDVILVWGHWACQYNIDVFTQPRFLKVANIVHQLAQICLKELVAAPNCVCCTPVNVKMYTNGRMGAIAVHRMEVG